MYMTSPELEAKDAQSIRTFLESVCSSELREPSRIPPLSYPVSERTSESRESDVNAQRSSNGSRNDEEKGKEDEEDESQYPSWRRIVPIMFSFYVALIIVALVRSPTSLSPVVDCSLLDSQKRSSTRWPLSLQRRSEL